MKQNLKINNNNHKAYSFIFDIITYVVHISTVGYRVETGLIKIVLKISYADSVPCRVVCVHLLPTSFESE